MKTFFRWLFRKLWKRRYVIAAKSRGIGRRGLWLYKKIVRSPNVHAIIKEVIFSSLNSMVFQTSKYQTWLSNRGAGSKISLFMARNEPGFDSQYDKAPVPVCPDDALWERLTKLKPPLKRADDISVDIIIPVYKGYDETLACIYSVLSNHVYTTYELIVINDASPDTELTNKLRELSAKQLFTLYENPENLGFVRTVNRGMQLHDNRDIVLLNADTEVYNDWLDRIHSVALRHVDTATVTPFSNNAEICSYPFFVKNNYMQLECDYAALDAIAARCNENAEVILPTAVGFCMYIKRSCLEDIGYFDAELFGKGYGEENDFCLRAIARGWNNVMAANVFVRHSGGSSFQGEKNERIAAATRIINKKYPAYASSVREFINTDPLRRMRVAMDAARLARGKDKAMLFISHSLGGGTERHIEDMVTLLSVEGVAVYMLRSDPINAKKVLLSSADNILAPNLVFDIDIDQQLLLESLKTLPLIQMHVHHIIGFDRSFPDFIAVMCDKLALPYDVTMHDYYAICPRVHLTDKAGYYCGEPDITACERCVRVNSSHSGGASVWQWRYRFSAFLKHARNVYVPNDDVALRLAKYFPDMHSIVRPHPQAIPEKTALIARHGGKKLRVGIIGALGPHKGSELILACVRDAKERNLPLEFTIIGYSNIDAIFASYNNVTITGAYEERDLPQLLVNSGCDLAFFSSLVPETFCYTYSSAVSVGLFPVSFDLGAVSQRIKTMGWGEVLPVKTMKHPQQVNDLLLKVHITPYPADVPITTYSNTYPTLLKDYYLLET
jgi:O-antigen biosynthesis protein